MTPPVSPDKVLRTWRLGRGPDNDFVINFASVSAHHAELDELEGGGFRLRDVGSRNGTYLGESAERITVAALRGDEVLRFSLGYKIPFPLLLQQLRSGRATADMGQQVTMARDVLRIGRAPDNDVRLGQLAASRYHAEIRRAADGSLRLRDLGSKLGTRVGGRIVRDEEVALGRDDVIEICGQRISLALPERGPVTGQAAGRVATDRAGHTLQVEGLALALPGGRRLLDDINFVVLPGELVAIMGPSGCGKSTLLNVCCGESAPTGGRVLYDGEDLSASPESILPFVGHVPQDDLLHPDLTVEEVLRAHARIRLPADVQADEIETKIAEVCRSIGLLDEARGIDLRKQLIGSTERKGLSGGQKKRVGLAMELLSDPRIIFLDEPTSGLSSHDTRQVVELLRQISVRHGVAIIVTIHQPAPSVYRLFDAVLFLKAGQMAFFGPAFPDAVRFFCPDRPPEEAGPDAVMEELDRLPAAALRKRYEESAYAVRSAQRRAATTAHTGGVAALGMQRLTAIRIQVLAVLQRDLRAKSRDRQSLAVMAAQPLLIGVLFGQLFMNADSAERWTATFLCALISFWFGLNMAAREMVAERPRVRRERRGGLSPLSYVVAKVILLGLLTLAQVVLFLGLANLQIHTVEWPQPTVFLLGWLTAFTGVCAGLVTSSIARTEIGAVALVPLQLIPMIFLGGLLLNYRQRLADLPLSRILADLSPLRWAFEAISTACLGGSAMFFPQPGVALPCAVLAAMSLVGLGLAWSRVRRW